MFATRVWLNQESYIDSWPTGPPTLGEVERSRLKFGIKRSIPFFRKESQIVLPLDLRLDLSLRCFEMTYKNILQKFCEKNYRFFISS